jgi:RNA polymerase sigma-70 factor (ECF subfamily)
MPPCFYPNPAFTIQRMSRIPSMTSVWDNILRDRSLSTAEFQPASLEEEITGYFDQFHDPLMRYLLSFQFGVQDAEDIIQETFFALFKHLRAEKPRTNVRGWIFRVAHNLGRKRRGTNQRIQRIAVADDQDTQFQLHPGLNPEEELLDTQERRRLLAIVRVLPDRDRQCLVLRAEGFRYREIAEVLGISLGTVAATLERSFKRLRTIESR